MPLGIAAEYRPRNAEHGVLYRVIDEHLETFLDAAAHHADGSRLPAFVEQEFRDFLACGVLERGFARLRCGECAFERLVPFSCKGRGFCPSCGGRRMTERAAHLVDAVLPRVPVRQWVLTMPYRPAWRRHERLTPPPAIRALGHSANHAVAAARSDASSRSARAQ